MVKAFFCPPIIVALLLSLVQAGLAASEDIRVERVHFKKGESSAVIEGSIEGYGIVDYVLRAKKGQYINVSMATDNDANYFNILAPGENEVAFFNGSTGGNMYEGVLPENGEYRIRVYQMRSAARRNEVAMYNLEILITDADDAGKTSQPSPSATKAPPKKADYNTTGNISCSVVKNQPAGSCPYGVIRGGYGNGLVTVTKPDGRTRTIFFEDGKAVGADSSQGDPGKFSTKQVGDVNVIHIGEERYEIPDAVVSGD